MIKVTTAKDVNILLTNENIKLIKKIFRQDRGCSTRLPYAKKKIREIYCSMANTKDNSTEELMKKVQESKGKTK